MQRITQEQIRDMNRHMIYMHVYNGRKNVLQQNISHMLKMSRPTLTNHLAAMEKDGLLSRGEAEHLGRKLVTWSIADDYRIALGVEILKHSVEIVAVNLYGEAFSCVKLSMEYENDERYYEAVSAKIREFISSLDIREAEHKILGIGIAFQGLVSEDGSTIIYGEILKCTGLKIDVFTKWLDYPCMFVHEPDGAALSELWVSPELDSAIYLSMSEHLGGALISHRKILNGQHRHTATFEHITAKPDGEMCYCGKRGCFETVCSKIALLRGAVKDPDEFFGQVRRGNSEAAARWQEFLWYLGRIIAHMHLVVDTKYILGGHLAPYFTEEDVNVLYDYVKKRTPFIEDNDYILRSKMPSHNITIGAALPYIMSFLENV